MPQAELPIGRVRKTHSPGSAMSNSLWSVGYLGIENPLTFLEKLNIMTPKLRIWVNRATRQQYSNYL